jgi:hypothetical protein
MQGAIIIEQFPIKRLTFQKERLKELQSTNTHSAFLGVYRSTVESILSLAGQATQGPYSLTLLLSLCM